MKRATSIQNEEDYDTYLNAIERKFLEQCHTWEDETTYANKKKSGFYLKQVVHCYRAMNGGEYNTFMFHLSLHRNMGKGNRVHVKVFEELPGTQFDIDLQFAVVPKQFYRRKQKHFFRFKDEMKYNVLSSFPLSVQLKENTKPHLRWAFDKVIQTTIIGQLNVTIM